eukprot:237555_1
MVSAFGTDICNDTAILQIVEWFIIVIGLITICSTLIIGYNKLQMPRKKPLPFVTRYMFYACILLTMLQFIVFGLTITICHTNIPNEWSYITTIALFTLYGTLISHLFLCWLSKLYLTFNRSVYAKSRRFYTIICSLFTLLILCAIIGSILIILSIPMGAILLTISSIGYFVISVFLLQVFLRQILHLVTCRIVTIRTVRSVASLRGAAGSIGLSSKDQVFITCITKYFVLGTASFMSTLLVLVTMILLVFFHINSSLHILQIFIMIDVTINTICVYLQFNFANRTYKTIFGFCDRSMHSKIEHRAIVELRDVNLNFYSDQFKASANQLPHVDSVNKSKCTRVNVESPESVISPNVDIVKLPEILDSINKPSQNNVISSESIRIAKADTYVELGDRSRSTSVDSQYASDNEKTGNCFNNKITVNLSPIPGSPENITIQESYNVIVHVDSEATAVGKKNQPQKTIVENNKNEV